MLLFAPLLLLALHIFLRLLFLHVDHGSRLRIDLNLHHPVLRRDDFVQWGCSEANRAVIDRS